VGFGALNTPVRLLGTSNGQPWEIPGWGMTDGNGGFKVEGRFAEGTQGTTPFTLRSEGCSQIPSPLWFRSKSESDDHSLHGCFEVKQRAKPTS